MPFQITQPQVSESAADLALALSESLTSQGESLAALAVLKLVEPLERDERVSCRLAEAALDAGDAPEALRLLARLWEAGSLDPYIEARLALAALAVGLYDVAEALTGPPSASLDHAVVRLVLGARRGETLEISGIASPTETIFALRSLLRVLAACGRHDLVDAVSHTALALPGLQSALAGIPSAPAPGLDFVKVPLDIARAAFTAGWGGAGGVAAANWAWAVAREIGQGERVLVLSPWPGAFPALLSHAEVVTVSPGAAPGATMIAEPERLPLAPARFAHVIAADWLGRSLNPERAMGELARVLAHDGQLHLLASGPAAPGDSHLTFAPRALVRLAERAGLGGNAVVARQASGLPAEGAACEVMLMRSVRRIA